MGMKYRKMAVWGGVGLWMWCCVGCVRFGCEGWCVCEAVLVVFWGVVAGVLGECGACGVCSHLLEMADFTVPPACRGNLKEGVRERRLALRAEVEQYRQQVGIVHNPVAVRICCGVVRAEVEQHL